MSVIFSNSEQNFPGASNLCAVYFFFFGLVGEGGGTLGSQTHGSNTRPYISRVHLTEADIFAICAVPHTLCAVYLGRRFLVLVNGRRFNL